MSERPTLREILDDEGISERDLAARSGLSHRTVARLLNGASPHLDECRKIAKVLGDGHEAHEVAIAILRGRMERARGVVADWLLPESIRNDSPYDLVYCLDSLWGLAHNQGATEGFRDAVLDLARILLDAVEAAHASTSPN